MWVLSLWYEVSIMEIIWGSCIYNILLSTKFIMHHKRILSTHELYETTAAFHGWWAYAVVVIHVLVPFQNSVIFLWTNNKPADSNYMRSLYHEWNVICMSIWYDYYWFSVCGGLSVPQLPVIIHDDYIQME